MEITHQTDIRLSICSLVFLSILIPSAFAMDPVRIDSTPIFTSDLTPAVQFNTTYNGTCKGNLEENVNYSEMAFDFEGNKSTHNYTFETAFDYGAYTVYAKCISDDLGEIFPGYYFGFITIPEESNPDLLPPSLTPEPPESEDPSPGGGGPSPGGGSWRPSTTIVENETVDEEVENEEEPEVEEQSEAEPEPAVVTEPEPTGPTGFATLGLRRISALTALGITLILGGYWFFIRKK